MIPIILIVAVIALLGRLAWLYTTFFDHILVNTIKAVIGLSAFVLMFDAKTNQGNSMLSGLFTYINEERLDRSTDQVVDLLASQENNLFEESHE
jgi:hypothetical protein